MGRIIGILGGMGPAATVDALDKLVQNTPATKDQEHIPVIVASLPDIPDRTKYLIDREISPFPKMLRSLKLLENAGANGIIMICNTAHYWYKELKENTSAEFISIIDATCESVVYRQAQKVAILATTGTISTELYQKAMQKRNVPYIIPSSVQQSAVMESIMAYKSGDIKGSFRLLSPVVKELENQGVDCFIMGCTEIPLILEEEKIRVPEKYIDSTEEVVKAAIHWYYQHSFPKN